MIFKKRATNNRQPTIKPMKNLVICLCMVFGVTMTSAQNEVNPIAPTEKKTYTTTKNEIVPPLIDGVINDDAWGQVPWGGNDFKQWQPDNGKEPTAQTEFKILYDDKNLYLAFRCHDDEPDKIVRRMSRRDGFEGDWVEINIDSYFDKRTAFSFTASVSGVKGDEMISNDGNNWESNWDPIWYLATNIDEKGWTAEARIPLSQLRFSDKEEQVWGIQVQRRNFRVEERSLWSLKPLNAAGWVSFFGELHGIRGVKPQKQLEIMPYTVAQLERTEEIPENPFQTGSDTRFSAGVDGKVGITNDFTLDFTINPDFGQVEADPSNLVLDGFEVFFNEQRPFFIENKNIFDYRISRSEAGGPFWSDNLFYSRRIGGSPHHYPSLNSGEFVDQPVNTTILGAAKFSGKTKKGLSVGILESITAKEMAEIDHNGDRREEVVEPLTNYFVGRLQQDYDGGNTVIGGILTATNRDIDTDALNYLHRSAYTGGVDFLHRWKDRLWYVQANLVGSQVNGTQEAITNTQESFAHFFQRPDADHLEVDTSLTSLSGHGGTFKIGRISDFSFEGGVTWRSPELELNDVGFMRTADQIYEFFWAGYRFNKPFSIFRSLRFNVNQWSSWDFGGVNTYRAYNTNFHMQYTNFYGMGMGFNYEEFSVSNNALRGGPALLMPGGFGMWGYAYSDSRKKFTVNYNYNGFWGEGGSFQGHSVWLRYQPLRTLNVAIAPSYNKRDFQLQYVQNVTNNLDGNTRYINGTVNQETFSASIRINYTINPDLSIQYYGSPFISKGTYNAFKYINQPKADEFTDRFITYSDNQITLDEAEGVYRIDENLDGVEDYNFYEPDFNFIQFRSNLVARWEYIPGSTLFLVWSQGLTSSGDPNDPILPSLTENVFSETADNIFLVKFTYRFVR